MGDRVVLEHDYKREIDGQLVRVTRLTWRSGGRSYDVTLIGDKGEEILLTPEESLDSDPTDEQIRILLGPENVNKGRAFARGE